MCNSSRRSDNKEHSDKQLARESNVSSEPQAGHEKTAIQDNFGHKDIDKGLLKHRLDVVYQSRPLNRNEKSRRLENTGLGKALTSTETLNKEVKELIHDTCRGSDELLDDDIIIVCPPNDQKHLKIEERFRKLSIFKEPQHLIYSDGDNKLALNDDAIKQISSIDLPLSIVAICGKYRTGKSYLMNKLATKEQVVGFTIGHRVASQTKGIWAWCKLHPKQTDTVLLLLDVEGMADVKKEGDNDHDIKLFCLVNLLSSVIIYNNQGIFDQDSLEKLAFITRMAENIRNTDDLAPDVNDETLRLLTSMFIMCLRDFHLQLEEDNRRFKNANEYFESVIELSAEPGHETNDKTKMCIQKYYPKRKCFIIRQPAMNEHLTRLEELDEKRLDRGFLAEVNNLKEFVYGCKPKLLDAVTKNLLKDLENYLYLHVVWLQLF